MSARKENQGVNANEESECSSESSEDSWITGVSKLSLAAATSAGSNGQNVTHSIITSASVWPSAEHSNVCWDKTETASDTGYVDDYESEDDFEEEVESEETEEDDGDDEAEDNDEETEDNDGETEEGDNSGETEEEDIGDEDSTTGGNWFNDWPQIPDTAEFLSFWKDEPEFDSFLSQDTVRAAVSVWFRESQCTKQWVETLSPIVANYSDARNFQKLRLRSFLREIGQRNIEVMEFADKCKPSLETMTKLHIADFQMSRDSLRGFERLNALESFRIGMVEYDSDVQLEDISYTFGGWQSIRELELWNLNEDCGSRYNATPRSKLWTEVLLSAANDTLERLTVAFYGKKNWPGVYPSFRYLVLSSLQYFQFWLRDDNTDIMEDILKELEMCHELYTIRVDFAHSLFDGSLAFDNWSECKPIVNQCTKLLSDACERTYAKYRIACNELQINENLQKMGLPPEYELEDLGMEFIVGRNAMFASEITGFGELILDGWDFPAFDLFLEPSFWTKRKTALSKLILNDGIGVLENVMFNSSGRMDEDLAETWKSKIMKLHESEIFKGMVQVSRYSGEWLLRVGNPDAKHPDEMSGDITKRMLKDAIDELGIAKDSTATQIEAAFESEAEEEKKQVTEETRVDVWLEYLPEDFEPKVSSVEEMLELNKSELRRLCKALCVKPYGRRLELAQRVLGFKAENRAPALYSADMEMDDCTDDEYDDSEYLNLEKLLFFPK